MSKVKIVTNYQEVETSEELKVVVDKIVSDFNNPNKKTGQYSYPLKFYWTAKNSRIFNNENDKQKVGKFKGVYLTQVYIDDQLVLDGEFVHTKNIADRSGAKSQLEGFLAGSYEPKLAEIIGDGKLKDITTFQPIPFQGDATVKEYLDKTLIWSPGDANHSEVCFPLVVNSFFKYNNFKYYNRWVGPDGGDGVYGNRFSAGYEDFPLSVYFAAVLDNIFKSSGYTMSGNVLNSEELKRLVLLCSNAKGGDMPYNYAALNPYREEFHFGKAKGIQNSEGQYYVFAFDLWGKVASGDLSFSIKENSLGQDYQGYYTPKTTFEADVEVKAQFDYWYRNNGTTTSTMNRYPGGNPPEMLLAFREITESEFLDINYEGKTFGSVLEPDVNTLLHQKIQQELSGKWTLTCSGRVKFEKGKQYIPQVYVCVKKEYELLDNYVTLAFGENFANNYVDVKNCSGLTELNPALWLPDWKQTDFLTHFFKLFNLYYSVNFDTRHVTLYTRDEFFELSQENIIDLSNYCNVELFDEEPFDSDHIAGADWYYSASAEDYVFENSDYLKLAQGEAAEGATELPFTAMTFFEKTWKAVDGTLYKDFVPYVLTSSEEESEDLGTVRTDNGFAYTPRLAFYFGKPISPGPLASSSVVLDWDLPLVRFIRSQTATGAQEGFYQVPKLLFFDGDSQVYYKYDVTNLLQQSDSSNDVFHTPSNFYVDEAAMNALSLERSSTKGISIFRRYYRNTSIINSQSNFMEGDCQMDSYLYNRLSGRNILRIADDLYLLDSINKYDLLKGKCTLKIYKLVNGS